MKKVSTVSKLKSIVQLQELTIERLNQTIVERAKLYIEELADLKEMAQDNVTGIQSECARMTMRAETAEEQNEYQTKQLRSLRELVQAYREQASSQRQRAEFYAIRFTSALNSMRKASTFNWFQRLLSVFMPKMEQVTATPEPNFTRNFPDAATQAIPHQEPIKDSRGKDLVAHFQPTVFKLNEKSFVPACGHGKENQQLRFYDGPGGMPGSVYVCKVCYPFPGGSIVPQPEEKNPNEGRNLQFSVVTNAPVPTTGRNPTNSNIGGAGLR